HGTCPEPLGRDIVKQPYVATPTTHLVGCDSLVAFRMVCVHVSGGSGEAAHAPAAHAGRGICWQRSGNGVAMLTQLAPSKKLVRQRCPHSPPGRGGEPQTRQLF